MLPFVVNVYLQGGSRERERERDGSVMQVKPLLQKRGPIDTK
jgi:hypothetical protein